MALSLDNKDKAYKSFLEKFAESHPQAPKLESTDPAEIAEHVCANAGQDEQRQWLDELMAVAAPGSRPGFGVIMLSVAGLIFGAIVIYGVFVSSSFLTLLGKPDGARGLITFLFAFATIAVVLISAIATFWINIEEVEKRGALAKEIITVLIGVMGTILGFYFGSLSQENQQADPQESGFYRALPPEISSPV